MAIAGCFLLVSINAQQPSRTTSSFDAGWKFLKADAKGAEQNDFNDVPWRSLDVPHDWSIEGPYDRNNTTGRGGGYLPGGIGWYRKTFSLNESDAKKLVFIEFDGIMANSDVWINGYHLGKRPNGYVSFEYELTGHLNFGKDKKNVIAVRADNTVQPASRWYTGAGIYRHVRLSVTNPVHLAHWGSFVTTSDITAEKATVNIEAKISNQSTAVQNLVIQTSIISPDGKTVGTIESRQKIESKKEETVKQKILLTKPALWDIENPQLYKAITKILMDKKSLDEEATSFGIRDIRFDAATGFSLNGKNLKIKGVCLHHEAGALGAAVPLTAWKRRLQSLKDLGVNGIRTAHNAVAPEFLDLCDKMGLLVMNETFDTWNSAKSHAEKGYNLYFTDWWERDTRDIVLRDRNHPSVVIYSIGNEIHDKLNDSTGFKKYKMQQDLIHLLDPTRPVTMALFRPGISKVYENGFAEIMDVVGQNYRENELVAAHEKNPNRKVIGTENGHGQGVWLPLRDKPYMSGQFLWTGIDYLGESDWPEVAHGSGLLDKTGGAKDIAYQRQSWWGDKPMLYVMRKQGNDGAGDWISDWSPTDIDTYDQAMLQVFSNCDEVELFLNDVSVGSKARPADNASPRSWSITFHKGTLKAVAKNAGKIVAEQQLITTGNPAKIVLSAHKPSIENNWDDVVYITATVTDEAGLPCLNATDKIRFNTDGPGVIAAVDNADLSCSDPYLTKERWAFKGKCIAIIKANANTGVIKVTAAADGLKTESININIKN
ncbi:MAG: glycoside hydrolase family 2 protein [Ferruginibacter sp.]|nr:glycoside hydrolase family 2 protein [Ferruginibacter sp.]